MRSVGGSVECSLPGAIPDGAERCWCPNSGHWGKSKAGGCDDDPKIRPLVDHMLGTEWGKGHGLVPCRELSTREYDRLGVMGAREVSGTQPRCPGAGAMLLKDQANQVRPDTSDCPSSPFPAYGDRERCKGMPRLRVKAVMFEPTPRATLR